MEILYSKSFLLFFFFYFEPLHFSCCQIHLSSSFPPFSSLSSYRHAVMFSICFDCCCSERGNDSGRWHAWQGCSWTLHLQLRKTTWRMHVRGVFAACVRVCVQHMCMRSCMCTVRLLFLIPKSHSSPCSQFPSSATFIHFLPCYSLTFQPGTKGLSGYGNV